MLLVHSHTDVKGNEIKETDGNIDRYHWLDEPVRIPFEITCTHAK